MKNTSIRTRILILLMLPMLGVIFFAGSAILEKRQIATNMEKIQSLTNLGPLIGALVHELQKERGTSAVYISTKGAKFSTKLPTQKKLTDEKKNVLSGAMNDFDTTSYNQTLVAKMKSANDALSKLDAMRGNVASFSATVPQMAKYYTPTIAKLLAIIEEMTALSIGTELTSPIVAYTAFLQNKERSGVERAMGGVGFGSGKFKPAIYNKFITLIGQQKTYFSIFNINATAEQKAYLQNTVKGDDVDDVARMREIAIASPQTSDLKGVTGPYWFGTITKKIDLMKKVEDRLASDLNKLSTSLRDSAQFTYMERLIETIAILVITIMLSTYIVKSIITPVNNLTTVMEALANKEWGTKVPNQDRGDEIGKMAAAVQVFKINGQEVERLETEQRTNEERNAQEKRQHMLDMANNFDNSVGDVVQSVSSSSTEMQSSAQTLTATAEHVAQQSKVVATASTEASQNVQAVASATEELSSSIQEISRQVSQSTQIAGTAVIEVQGTNKKIQGLAEAANKIGEVVAMITDIADQTNLLALNATIEAARAGDAGKGFAVVASEVKNLANQTAKATEEISAQISDVQGATQEAVTAIGSIGGTINQLNEISSAIAAAVEEQGAATQEIARNVEQAAKGTTEVSSNISDVRQAAGETGASANDMLKSASELSQQSKLLRTEVDKFLNNIRNS